MKGLLSHLVNYFNPDKEFIQRIANPQNAPAPIMGENGQYHTHLMSAEFIGPNRIPAAFPTVINRDGKLVRLSKEDAMDYAYNTGNYIAFDNIQMADEYSQNYKTPNFQRYYQMRGLLDNLGK